MNTTTPPSYQGSCHCGQIAFTVDGVLTGAMDCNCSLCQRKGALLWFVPRAQLHLQTPAEAMRTYTFHKHVIQHHFCPTCGIHPFGEATGPDGVRMAAVNIRCLEGVDLAALLVHHYDGRAA
jgi:hypothetical protein